ncbi:hypothetical protein D3C72_2243740 [compost metagenome]
MLQRHHQLKGCLCPVVLKLDDPGAGLDNLRYAAGAQHCDGGGESGLLNRFCQKFINHNYMLSAVLLQEILQCA